MRSLLGAASTLIGGAVHTASGGWLCRVCGKVVEAGLAEARCTCVREGKR